MERSGPIGIAFAVVINIVLAIGWLSGPGPALEAALMGGGAMAVLVLYAGSWVTMLHGEADRQLIGIGAATLGFQLIAATFAGFVSSHIVIGLAFLIAAMCVAVLAWLALKNVRATA